MTVYTGKIEMQSKDHMPHFHNITEDVKRIVAESGVKNGTVTIYSHHTTCSVMIQESSHDTNYYGREYMQMDLIEIMERLIPKGEKTIRAHLLHLKEHHETELLAQGLRYLKEHNIKIDMNTENKNGPIICKNEFL